MNLDIDFEGPDAFFKKLGPNALREMTGQLYGEEIQELNPEKQKKVLSDSAKATGIDFILRKCTKPTLLALGKGEFKKKAASGTKVKLIEELSKRIEDKGLRAFLEDKEAGLLRDIALKNALVEAEGAEDAEELVDLIVAETEVRGVHKILDSFSSYSLKDFCTEIEISSESMSKKRLIQTLMTGTDPGTKAVRVKEVKEKPDLVAGISWLDIYNNYTLKDIAEYFKNQGDTLPPGDKEKKVDKLFDMLNPGETPEKFEVEKYYPSSEDSEISDYDDVSFDESSEEDAPSRKRKRKSATKKKKASAGRKKRKVSGGKRKSSGTKKRRGSGKRN